MSLFVSVLICSYNRGGFLAETLPTLANQTLGFAGWEIIVVDNNSTDNTKEVVTGFFRSNPGLAGRYVFEEQQGLSYARNRAYAEAGADWVFYLDDDAKAREDLLARLKFLVSGAYFEVVGGVYYPWYRYGKPVWYKDKYGSNYRPLKELGVPKQPYSVSGGVMLWRKDLLQDLGGFDVNVGMKGDTIAYGEESFLQAKARERGIDIGYDPHLVIFHVVMKQKLKVNWFFLSNYAAGRDAVIGGAKSATIKSFFTELFMMMATLAKSLLVFTPNLFSKQYYVQNWAIDVFHPFAYRIGVLRTQLRSYFAGDINS